jgi:FMN reductase [NAD(P)H]
MNETVRLLQAHHSSRNLRIDPVPPEILDAIIESAHRAPSSINSQQVSLVVVRNAASRALIADIAGGQPWIAQAPVFIAVVADFYKTGLGVEKAGAEQVFQRSLEAIVSAVSDAGITMATLMTAARAFGLGIVPIGGIRRDPQAMNRSAWFATEYFSRCRSRTRLRRRRGAAKAAHGDRELSSRGKV